MAGLKMTAGLENVQSPSRSDASVKLWKLRAETVNKCGCGSDEQYSCVRILQQLRKNRPEQTAGGAVKTGEYPHDATRISCLFALRCLAAGFRAFVGNIAENSQQAGRGFGWRQALQQLQILL